MSSEIPPDPKGLDEFDREVLGLDDGLACPYPDYSKGSAEASLPATGRSAEGVKREVWDALYAVEDPEMPISIVDLGLIYGVTVEYDHARVDMTLTYTGCPAREMLLDDVEAAAASVEGIDAAEVRLVWNPPWSVEMVTEAGKESLREFGLSV